jgi:hypothetical protein
MKKRTQNYYLYMYMSIYVDAMIACRLCLIHINIEYEINTQPLPSKV